MFRDPYYKQIRRRLRELQDDKGFEACATDLLQRIYPTLAPREGGDDAGLDGLIADAGEDSTQLVCTIGTDVLGNLTRSIESNKKKGGRSRFCVFATSRHLTNAKKRTLEGRAIELGRPIRNIYDQAAFAQILYRDSRWAKELLGVTGNPPAISGFPLTSRPLSDNGPIGREDEVKALSQGTGDMVLVGQPGCGKTHLLYHYGLKTGGKFVVTENLGEIAAAVRDLSPKVLFIDDAGSRLDFVVALRQARQATKATFRIVVTCWPGQGEELQRALQVTRSSIIELHGLAPRLIKQIINNEGVFGPDNLLHELIHQAQGKAGLAVTLTRLCRESNVREVAVGTALARDIKCTFEPLLGKEAIDLLAVFAISGSAGMEVEKAAALIEKGPLQTRRLVEQLALAGALEVVRDNRVTVIPQRLRQALVRDVFLVPPFLNVESYFEACPDFGATLEVLIDAKILGGQLSNEFLQKKLVIFASDERNLFRDRPFQGFASLGKNETEWVLDVFPHLLWSIAPVALIRSPRKTLERLLAAAHGESPVQFTQDQTKTIKEIDEWILTAHTASEEAVLRRAALLDAVSEWVQDHEVSSLCVRLTRLSLSNRHESTSTPPGEPMQFSFRNGILSRHLLPKVAALWPKALPILALAPVSEGKLIADLFHPWIFPTFFVKPLPDGYETEARVFARSMMTELLRALDGKWTFHHHLRNYAKKLGIESEIKIDAVSEALYPSRELNDVDKREERNRITADMLVTKLKAMPTEAAVDLLILKRSEARSAEVSLWWDTYVVEQLSQTAPTVEPWVDAFFSNSMPCLLVEPFVVRLLKENPMMGEKRLFQMMELPILIAAAVRLIVQNFSPGTALWSEATPHIESVSGSIGVWLRQANYPKDATKLLLRRGGPVSEEIAESIWYSNHKVPVEGEFLTEWSDVIVSQTKKDHLLTQVFEKMPDIAKRWLDVTFKNTELSEVLFFPSKYDSALPTAISILTEAERLHFLGLVCPKSGHAEVLKMLVGSSSSLFSALLKRDELNRMRLAPLTVFGGLDGDEENPNIGQAWEQMAIQALDAGFSEEEIFSATCGDGWSWSGAVSSMYEKRMKPFEILRAKSDPRLRRIGEIGLARYSKVLADQLAAEKKAESKGEVY